MWEFFKDFVNPERKIIDHDSATDPGVAPDERRRLFAVAIARAAVVDELDELIEVIGQLDLVPVPRDRSDIVVNRYRQVVLAREAGHSGESRVIGVRPFSGGEIGQVVVARHDFANAFPHPRKLLDALDEQVDCTEVRRVEAAEGWMDPI